MNLLEKFTQINTFVFDVDGVMTNGDLILMPDGKFLRTVNIKDGYALQLAIKKGYNVWVITGSSSDEVANRMKYLGVTEFYQKVKDKKILLLDLMQKYSIPANQVLFMGDDMPDLTVMQTIAIAACPADAATDIVTMASYISPYKGGKGCVRDVIEKVMKLRGDWGSEDEVMSV